jgi:hypothetical protein
LNVTAEVRIESPSPLRVESAHVVTLRLADVAYGIDLEHVERLATEFAPTTRPQLKRADAKSISYGVPPVELSLGSADVSVAGERVKAELTARLFDFGAVSIAVRIVAGGRQWVDFARFIRDIDEALREARWPGWNEYLDRICVMAKPAFDKPDEHGIVEDYMLTTVQRFDRPITGEQLLAAVDLAGLLSREAKPLSEAARREVLRNVFTYYPDDLVALTWDHAFILEPSGDTEIADVLEVANAQLLEMRQYNANLDSELPRMYDRVEKARSRLSLSRRAYAKLAGEIYARVAEVTEIAERVDNALKVTEDVYLARIYGAANELFRVRAWYAAVERKLAIMRDTYTALYDEAATARAELLELAIVLLIVFEIVMAFLR